VYTVFSLLLNVSSVVKYFYENQIKNEWRGAEKTQIFFGLNLHEETIR